MKKVLTLFTVLSLMVTMAGCSSKEETKDPETKPPVTEDLMSQLNGIEIEYWHAQSSENGTALDTIVKNFNDTNEYGITVKATYQGGYTDSANKIQASLVANNYPNVAQAYGNNIAEFLKSEKVVNLTPYFENETYGYTKEQLDDFVPSYLEEMHAFEDGNYYQTMMAKSTELLYYNVDMFEEHDLKVPTTTDELTEVAKTLSEIIGQPAFGYDSLSNLFITYCQAFGAEYTNNHGDVFFGNEENKQFTLDFLNWWKAGVDGGYFRLAGEDNYMSAVFNNELCAMFIGSSSGANYISDEINWKAAQVPAGPVKQVTMQQGGNVFMLDSGNDAENLASWLFMKFMMEPEQTAIYSMNTGYVPIRVSSYLLPEYVEYISGAGAIGQAKDVTNSYPAGSITFDPIFAASYTIRKAGQTIIEDITVNKAEPETVLDTEYAKLTK